MMAWSRSSSTPGAASWEAMPARSSSPGAELKWFEGSELRTGIYKLLRRMGLRVEGRDRQALDDAITSVSVKDGWRA